MIDMRSDTVTHPTEAMRKAMSLAEVGDDVFGDDPTVNALEALAAVRMGKEAALFVPSGTMGNLLAVMTHTHPGQQIILGKEAHIYLFEVCGYARLSGVGVKTLDETHGEMSADEVADSIQKRYNIHHGGTGLLCLENTHNVAGGIALSLDYMKRMKDIAEAHGLPVHLDGARIFNAAEALGVEARDIAGYADSVMFCLSKGLAAPVGSLLCGEKAFIEKARHNRKLVGGGMRQAGILAAAGMIAIETMSLRLKEDHENAKALAEGLAGLPDFIIDPKWVHTNIVFAQVKPGKNAYALADALQEEGVLISPFGDTRVRFTLHYQITRGDVQKTLDILAKTAASAV